MNICLKLVAAFLFIAAFTFPVQAQSQEPGQVAGKLLEPTTKEPLGFATVGLFTAKDSVLVSSTTSNEAGFFQLQHLPYGNYYLSISLVGYNAKKLSNLSLSASQSDLNLGTIMVNSATRKISEVEIVAQKELVEYGLDKQVINVAKDISSTGGTASDALKNAPSVAVDIDGNVSVRGSSNVTVLVDGKNSGQSAQTILSQTPASAIEKIEVITNPSAKYDAEGMGGIINIILKKEKKPGLNGSVTVNAGTCHNYNTSLNLNYNIKKFNFFAGHDFHQNSRTSEYDLYSYRGSGYLEEDQDGQRVGRMHLPKLGFDYQLSDKQTITLSGKSFINKMTEEDNLRNLIRRPQLPDSLFSRIGDIENEIMGTDLTLSYRKTFSQKGRELTASTVYSRIDGHFYRFIDEFLADENYNATSPAIKENYLQNFQVRPFVLQADYIHPIGEKGKIETGLKHAQRKLETDFAGEFSDRETGNLLRVDSLSSTFNFNDYISAAYANYNNSWKKLSYQFGIRTENTIVNLMDHSDEIPYETSYLNFFPSVFLSQEIDENRKVQLNYSRRVNRPHYEAMNPFRNYSDKSNVWSGNPKLRPEYIDSYEASYVQFWKSGSLTNTIFYRNVHNLIQQVRTLDPVDSLIAYNSYVNLDNAESYGLEISGSQSVAKWWKLSGNVSAFNYKVIGNSLGAEANSERFSWLARLNSNFNLPKNLSVQISVNYRSPQALAQGTRDALYNTDIALKKDVLKKKGAITLRVSDVFNTLEWNTSVSDKNFTYDLYSKRQTRIAFLGFTYRFGNDQEKRRRPEAGSGLENMF